MATTSESAYATSAAASLPSMEVLGMCPSSPVAEPTRNGRKAPPRSNEVPTTCRSVEAAHRAFGPTGAPEQDRGVDHVATAVGAHDHRVQVELGDLGVIGDQLRDPGDDVGDLVEGVVGEPGGGPGARDERPC